MSKKIDDDFPIEEAISLDSANKLMESIEDGHDNNNTDANMVNNKTQDEDFKKHVSSIVSATANALKNLEQIINNYNELEQKLVTQVSQKLLHLMPANIKSVEPSLLTPLMELYLLVEDEPQRSEACLNLLANAMNVDTAPMTSLPAILQLLNSLGNDELKILALFVKPDAIHPIIDIINHSLKPEEGGIEALVNFTLIPETAKCQYVALSPMYMDNLIRIGILDVQGRYNDDAYADLEQHPVVQETVRLIAQQPGRKFIINKKAPRPTEIGSLLIRTCIMDNKQLCEFLHNTMKMAQERGMTEPSVDLE